MDPLERVKLPATFLQVTAIVGIVWQVIMIVVNLLGVGMASQMGGDDLLARMFSGAVGVVFAVIAIIIGVVVFLAASKMKKLESFGFAVAGTILAMVPCISPCCLIGLPIGIWALVVLLNDEVKAAFS